MNTKKPKTVRTSFVFLLVLAIAAPLHAGPGDALAGLRNTLGTLDAGTAIHGVLDVTSKHIKGKEGSGHEQSAHLQLQMQAGKGLSLQFSPALLRKVAQEKHARGDKSGHGTPTADLLGQTGALDIENMVSTAPMLTRLLANAKSVTIKPTQLDGHAVRKLSMKLPKPKSGASDFAKLKDYAGKASVWIGSDGTPLAYSFAYQGKFCKMFLCVTFHQSGNGTLQVMGGRLVTVKRIEKQHQSGLGQDGSTRTEYVLHARLATSGASG